MVVLRIFGIGISAGCARFHRMHLVRYRDIKRVRFERREEPYLNAWLMPNDYDSAFPVHRISLAQHIYTQTLKAPRVIAPCLPPPCSALPALCRSAGFLRPPPTPKWAKKNCPLQKAFYRLAGSPAYKLKDLKSKIKHQPSLMIGFSLPQVTAGIFCCVGRGWALEIEWKRYPGCPRPPFLNHAYVDSKKPIRRL